MRRLSVEEVLALHPLVSEKSGGGTGLRDRGLLESAVYSADAAFGGVELYPTAEEKAARLMFALVSNQRIGVLCLLLILDLNHVPLSYTQDELARLGLGVAAGEIDYDGILLWITQHKL